MNDSFLELNIAHKTFSQSDSFHVHNFNDVCFTAFIYNEEIHRSF